MLGLHVVGQVPLQKAAQVVNLKTEGCAGPCLFVFFAIDQAGCRYPLGRVGQHADGLWLQHRQVAMHHQHIAFRLGDQGHGKQNALCHGIRVFLGDIAGFFPDMGAHPVSVKPNRYNGFLLNMLFAGRKDPFYHTPAADLMEDLLLPGMHPLSFACCKNDCRDRFHAYPSKFFAHIKGHNRCYYFMSGQRALSREGGLAYKYI